MTYEQFKNINDYYKSLGCIQGRIEKVNLGKRKCRLRVNGSVSVVNIDELVMDICNGLGCVSNPSALIEFRFNGIRETSVFSSAQESNTNKVDIPQQNAVKNTGINLGDKYLYSSNKTINICHGSSKVVEKPQYGLGEPTNDYGKGFYCVFDKNIELAREWECSPYNKSNTGIVNKYELDTEGLKVLNLDKLDIIYWVAITASNRLINGNEELLEKIVDKYLIDISQYDCIYGWRCDDTFSRIIRGFLDGSFTSEAVKAATHLGYLQSQYVLKSQEAFSRIKFTGYEPINDFRKYKNRFTKRKDEADGGLRQCSITHSKGKRVHDYLD